MRISVEASKRDIELAFDWIGSLTGAELDKRVAAFQRHERANPLLATHFREHFALEFTLAEARKYRKNTEHRLPKGGEYDQLYGFLIAAHRICSAEYSLSNLTSWPEPDGDSDLHEFFDREFRIKNSHLMLHGRPGVSIVAVIITSSQADTVIDTIAAQAKDAADQCSGTRPALIALHLIDPIRGPELQAMLKMANGLHAIAGAVFSGSNRLHVDSIAFTVPQRPQSDGFGAKWLSGDVIALNNPQPQFPCDELRRIFRRS